MELWTKRYFNTFVEKTLPVKSVVKRYPSVISSDSRNMVTQLSSTEHVRNKHQRI